MHRHGLIAIIFLNFLFLPVSYSKDLQEKYLKNFQEGLALLDSKDFKGAYSKFKKSAGEKFLLKDYSHIFMAQALKEASKPEKALSLIEKSKREIPPSPHLSRLLGDIYLDLGMYDKACDSFSDYYKKSRNYRDRATFHKFSLAFAKSSHPEEFFIMHLISFLKNGHERPGSLAHMEDILAAYSSGTDLAGMYKSLGFPRTAINITRSDILWKGHGSGDLSYMVRIAQRLKDYPLKVKLLKELLGRKSEKLARAKIEFQIALAYLNMDKESSSLRYFMRASKNSKGDFTSAEADYYCGRIWEFWGDTTKAVFYYRKAKKRRFAGSEERNFIIKSLSRAGWVNYKSKKYFSALKDYGYLAEKFTLKPSEDGYAFWLGMTLTKLGRLDEARSVFESLFTAYPLSYYALLGASKLKNSFGVDIIIPHADPEYAGSVDPGKTYLINRALMLLSLGLSEFSKNEMAKIDTDYNNTSEIVLASIVYNFLENHRKSLALVDFVINLKKGMPSTELLNLYYPLRYFHYISHLSEQYGIDPYMIFSILRQESAFDPMAVSPAGAKGLMQVLPSLGLKTAKDLNFGEIAEADLLSPKYNLKIGIAHFAELYVKFGKNLALAACAYNSSESKVFGWMKKYPFGNIEEFIEDIPYFETRNYAKMILRNHANYLRIYGRDRREAIKGGP